MTSFLELSCHDIVQGRTYTIPVLLGHGRRVSPRHVFRIVPMGLVNMGKVMNQPNVSCSPKDTQ